MGHEQHQLDNERIVYILDTRMVILLQIASQDKERFHARTSSQPFGTPNRTTVICVIFTRGN